MSPALGEAPPHVRPPRILNTMKCYPLGIAAHIAIALDCIRRGDLDGAAAALSRAAVLSRGAAGQGRPSA